MPDWITTLNDIILEMRTTLAALENGKIRFVQVPEDGRHGDATAGQINLMRRQIGALEAIAEGQGAAK